MCAPVCVSGTGNFQPCPCSPTVPRGCSCSQNLQPSSGRPQETQLLHGPCLPELQCRDVCPTLQKSVAFPDSQEPEAVPALPCVLYSLCHCCAVPTCHRRDSRSCASLCLGHFACWHSGEGAAEVSCLPNLFCARTTCSLGKLSPQLCAWMADSASCWVLSQQENVAVAVGCSQLLLCRSCLSLARVLGHSNALLSSAGCFSFKNHLTRSPSELRAPALGFQDPKHRDLSSLCWWLWTGKQATISVMVLLLSCFLRTTPECQVLSMPSALIKL